MSSNTTISLKGRVTSIHAGIWFFISIIMSSLLSPGAAIAESNITIVADQAKIVKIAGEVSTVIVGNPAFADVSVQKSYIIVHGRNFGRTNILVLDENGNKLADLHVNITRGPNRNVAVFRAGLKASYACSPRCESTLQVGDDKDYFESVHRSITTKMSLAQQAAQITQK